MTLDLSVLPRYASVLRRRHFPIAVILVVSLSIRLYLAFTCKALPDFSDMERYSVYALQGGITVSPPPGYPLFLRFVYTLFGARNYTAVFAIQGLISTFTVFLVYFAAVRAAGRREGLIAACVAAVYPNFLVYNLVTLSETLGICFVMLIVALLLSNIGERRRAVFAGALLIAGCAIRPVFLFFWPGILLGIRRKTIFAVTTILLLSPWIIYTAASGRAPNRGARAFYKTYNPASSGKQYIEMKQTQLYKSNLPSRVYLREAFRFILNNKWKTLDIIYNKLAMIFSRGWDNHFMRRVVGPGVLIRLIMIYAFIPVMVLGFSGMVIFYDRGNRIMALMTASYLLFFVLMAIFKVRYRVLVEPMLIIYASMAAAALFRWGKGERTVGGGGS